MSKGLVDETVPGPSERSTADSRRTLTTRGGASPQPTGVLGCGWRAEDAEAVAAWLEDLHLSFRALGCKSDSLCQPPTIPHLNHHLGVQISMVLLVVQVESLILPRLYTLTALWREICLPLSLSTLHTHTKTRTCGWNGGNRKPSPKEFYHYELLF